MRMALVAAVVAALALAGCSNSDEDPTGSSTPAESSATSPTAESNPSETPSTSEEPDDGAVAVQIKIEGGQVEPNGQRLEVGAGEPIRLEIESDRAAELHVHSRPEQEFEVEPGSSTVDLTVDTPGVVDVEEHESGVVVLQLEVH